MLDFLQYGFMQRAFIAGILIALLCGVIGLFLVLRRMAMLGDGLSHISFGGVAAGMLFGVNPIISALVFSVIGAFGIQKLKQKKVYGDSAIAILFSFGLALGVLLISLSRGFNADLYSYLFGSILAVRGQDIIIISILGLGVLSTVFLFYKELFYITFDENSARASGLPVEKLDTLLVVLTSVIVVLSMQIVGILLVSSLIVIPASTALLLFKSFKKTMLGAIVFAIAAVILGLISAFYFNLAAGGAIVMVLVAAFFAALLFRKR
ncbi:MAG: metal ABC transporter permease [Candidatus Altiarchaeia archaeon]